MGIEDYKEVTNKKQPHTEEEGQMMDELVERHIIAMFNEASARDLCGTCIIKSLLTSSMGTVLANFGLVRGGEIMQRAANLVVGDFMTGGNMSKVVELKDQKKH